jgi:hypothetical protein
MGKTASSTWSVVETKGLATEDHVASLEHDCSILCTTTIKAVKKDLGLRPFKF